MATAFAVAPSTSKVFQLAAVKSSPSSAQYAKHKLRVKPYYTPVFTMTKEQWLKTLAAPWFRNTDPMMPLYPYGKNHHFPEANYGLYGGANLQTGNKISKGRNKGKTLRKWFPNIRFESIYSQALDKTLHIPIRAKVIRTIRKLGGLDQYLLGDRPARIKELGLLGWKLRWLVMTSPKMRQKYAEERKKLGLPETYSAIQTFEDAWNDPATRDHLIQEQEDAWAKLKAKMDKWDTHVDEKWFPADQKYAGVIEPYTAAKHARPVTLLSTSPTQLNLPLRIKEVPHEQLDQLSEEPEQELASEEELSFIKEDTIPATAEEDEEPWEDDISANAHKNYTLRREKRQKSSKQEQWAVADSVKRKVFMQKTKTRGGWSGGLKRRRRLELT